MDFEQILTTDTRLNWGVVKFEIVTKLWKERKITGNEIRVGVLDSGHIPDHSDVSIFPKSKEDFSGKPPDNGPINKHGVWCAGVIGAAGSEVFGVAPEAGIAYGRVAINSKSLAQGIEWLLTVRPSVQVISISLELFRENDSATDFETLKSAINNAEAKGKVVVAAVGNDFARRREMVERYPAAFPNVLAIGAIKEDLNLHEESGMNKCIDLVAPGHHLLTTEQGGGVNNDFGRTSAAAAYASGSIALVLQALKEKNREMTPSEISKLLKDTATFNFVGAQKCSSNLYGCGIINPVAAIDKIISQD